MRKLFFALLLGTAACAGGSGTVAYSSGGYVAAQPDMVYVDDGVQVIADYDEPIFYTNGFYWRYYGNTWYRSPTWTGGWVYATPPHRLSRIESPRTYIRYRPHGYVSRRPARVERDRYYRQNRNRGVEVRDHRHRR